MHARSLDHDELSRPRTFGLAAGWLSRAILAGFVATFVMLLVFLLAYGLASLASTAPSLTTSAELRRSSPLGALSRVGEAPLGAIPGAETLRLWLYNLTHNPLIDFAKANVYTALALHLAAGLAWSAVYAALAEPRLSGPGWRRGVTFSLLPAVLSVVVFLPLVGAGMLGSELGAGPLPIIGNVVVHLIYGATLGQLYGPFGALDASTLEGPSDDRAVIAQRSDRITANGLLVGLGIGVLMGVGVPLLVGVRANDELLGQPAAALMLSTVLISGVLGVSIGSFVGLSEPGEPRVPA